MDHRKLRIAWSLAWGIAAVLLIALWVRSYSRVEIISYTNSAKVFIGVRSERGMLKIYRGDIRPIGAGWNYRRLDLPASTFPSFYSNWTNGFGSTQVQGWLLILLSSLLAISPWVGQLRLRFSLRTLLVATTLVAVGLGLMIYAARK